MKSADVKEGFFRRAVSFAREDHRFVFLGTSALAASGVLLSAVGYPPPMPGGAPAAITAAGVVCLLWMALSALAGVYKVTHWPTYAKASPFVRAGGRRAIRYCSYVVWAAVGVVAFDVFVLGFVRACLLATSLTDNPQDFLTSSIYMIYSSQGIILHGISTTIELAVFGTVVAFLLALGLVFLRVQEIDRCDSYLLRFFKVLGSGFARLYSTIIRGTPMMVQGLIIYYGGFNLMKAAGMGINQTQEIWSFFVAGLVTLSLCSAAYMAEVLRASIEAIDPGQLEAARSLGLTQWQGMRTIVFPQGVRNALPALSNELIINIKDSSVLSVIGVFDLMYATTSVAGIYYRQMELYVAAALIYLALTCVAGRILSAVSARRGMGTRGVMSTGGSVSIGEEMIGHE